MSNKKITLRSYIDSLIVLGEDKDELETWYILFDTLNEEEQDKILGNFENELEKLKNLEK